MKARGENSKLPRVRASSNEGRLEQMHQAALLLLLLETDKSEVNCPPLLLFNEVCLCLPVPTSRRRSSPLVLIIAYRVVRSLRLQKRQRERRDARICAAFVRSFLALPPSRPRLLLLKQDKVR